MKKKKCINSSMNILTRYFHQKMWVSKRLQRSALSNGYAKKIQRIQGKGKRIWDIFHWPF